MKAFHLVGPAPFYTNSFLLISDAGSAVVIDPAAEVQEYDKILKEHGGKLSLILCTHGHYDHVGSAGVLSREWGAKLYCEPADCRGTQLLPLKGSDSGYEEGEVIPLDELRDRAGELPKEKPVNIHCHSGLRSYIACRLLTGLGYDCYNLSGGWRLYESILSETKSPEHGCYDPN